MHRPYNDSSEGNMTGERNIRAKQGARSGLKVVAKMKRSDNIPSASLLMLYNLLASCLLERSR